MNTIVNMPTLKQNLFSNEDIISLGKIWIKLKEDSDDYEWEYNRGVIDGVEYMLYLLERSGD